MIAILKIDLFFIILFSFLFEYTLAICSFQYYNPYLLQSPQLNFDSEINISNQNCILKTNNSVIFRKIYITNINCSYSDTSGFDQCYENFIIALQEENKIALINLFTSFIFLLSNGDHYIMRTSVELFEEELFRRDFADIVIKPVNPSDYVNIHIKTNEFFIFISKSLVIENIEFDGNDIEAQIDNNISACYNNMNLICCSENDYLTVENNTQTNENSCNIYNMTLKLDEKIKFYGLFNLEGVFDNENYLIPILEIKNCKFYNFYAIFFNKGWASFISLAPYSGSLIITDTIFSNSYYSGGFIYYTQTSFDPLWSLIVNDNNNFEIYEQNILLNNSNFDNYNEYFINNIDTFSFIHLISFSGNLTIVNSSFHNIFRSNNIVLIQNSIYNGNIVIKNISIQNIFNMQILKVNFVKFILIEEFLIFNSNSVQSNLFTINNVLENNIFHIVLNSILLSDIFYCFALDNSNTQINNSFFNVISSNGLIYNENSDIWLINNSFTNIFSSGNLFSFINHNSSNISFCYLNNITGLNALFFISNINSGLLSNTMIKHVYFFTIYFIEKTLINDNEGLYIMESNVTNFWSTDHTCVITKSFNSFFAYNEIYDDIISLYSLPSIYFIFTFSQIRNNNFYSLNMIIMLVGVCNFTDAIITNNYFLNTPLFGAVFDLEMQAQIYFDQCYFQDNGVIVKKTEYLAYDDNVLITIWSIRLTRFSNSYFIVSNLIDLASGFIDSIPHQGLFESYNNSFIIIDANPNFSYKIMLIDHFITALFINNTFINLLCNHIDFNHAHGGILLSANAAFSYSKNDYTLYIENNTFLNTSCLYGSLDIFGICNVTMKNNYFNQSISQYYGGHLILVAGENVLIDGIFLNNSSGDEGAGMFLQNFNNILILNLVLINVISQKNGVIFCKDVNLLEIYGGFASNLYTLMNGGFIYLFHSSAVMFNITIISSNALINGGVMFINEGSNLNISNSIFCNVSSSVGGSFYVDNALEISINESILINSTSLDKGGAIFIDSIDFFEMNNVFFFKCFSSGNGILFIKTETELTSFTFDNITCSKTRSKAGSCIYYLSSSLLDITNLYIIENGPSPIVVTWSFIILIKFTNVTIINTFIHDNLVEFSGIEIECNLWMIINSSANVLIYLENVVGDVENIFFLKNKAIYAFNVESSSINFSQIFIVKNLDLGCLYDTKSTLNIDNIFIESSFTSQSHYIYFQEGDYSINHSKFINNTGQIFIIINSNLNIDYSNFINNTFNEESMPNDINYENSNILNYVVKIQNSLFVVNNGFSLKSIGLIKLLIYKTSYLCFGVNSCYSLYLSDLSNIYMIKSNFVNFTKGNIFVYSLYSLQYTEILMISNYFYNNSGYLGSVLYMYGNFEMKMSNSLFKNNKALINLNDSINILQGIAPCIFMKEMNIVLSKIQIFSSYFENNFAAYIGPTVFFQFQVESTNNSFVNNSDSFNFSEKMYSYPLFFQRVFNQTSINELVIEIVSGVAFSLEFIIVDYFNQTLSFDNKTIAIIKQNVLDNNADDSISLQNGLTQAKVGSLNFQNLIILKAPNSYFNLSLTGLFAGLTNNPFNELNSLQIQKNLQFYTRKCLIGEIVLKDNSCFVCKQGTYSLIDPMMIGMKFQKCYDCPLNCFCYSGFYISPLYGYYRKYNISTNVAACLNADACLGDQWPLNSTQGTRSFNNEQCRKGNNGTLCFYCDPNNGRYQKSDYCKPCASVEVLMYIRFILSFLALIIYIMLNFILAENSHLDQEKTNKPKYSFNSSTFFKILINHCQQISIILATNTVYKFNNFEDFFNVFDYFSFSNDQVLSNDCLIEKFYVFDREVVIVFKNIFNIFLPLIFSLISFLFWFILSYFLSGIKRFSLSMQLPKNLKSFFTKIFLFALFTTFIFYSLIVKSCFSLFNCMKIDNIDPYTYLRESPDMRCWINPHITYIFFLGLPALIVWGVIYPSFLYFIIRKNFIIKQNYENSILFKKSSSFQKTFKELSKKNSPTNNTKKQQFKKIKVTCNTMNIEKNVNINNKNIELSPINNSKQLKQTKTKTMHIICKIDNEPENERENMEHEDKIIQGLGVLSESKKLQKLRTSKEKITYIHNVLEKIESSKLFVFFYKDYKPKYYYWECLIFFRKFILSFFSAMCETFSIEIVLIFMTIILLISLHTTMNNFPYKIRTANLLELLSLIVLCFTIFSSLIFNSDCSSNVKSYFELACIIINLIFLGYLIFNLIFDILSILRISRKEKKYNESVAKYRQSNEIQNSIHS